MNALVNGGAGGFGAGKAPVQPPGIQETVIAGGVALAGVVGAVMPDSVKK